MSRVAHLAGAAALISLAFAAGYAVRDGAVVSAPAAADEAVVKPAYMVVTGTVLDDDAFVAGYAAHLPPLYEKHGGRYLAIGRGPEFLEGEADFASFVVAEWPSADAARAFWNDPEYVALREARLEGGWGAFDVFLVEGLATPSRVSPLVEPSVD